MTEGQQPFLVTIHCVFGWRGSEDSPELLDAWDDYTVEQNWEGWEKAAEKAAEDNEIPMRNIRIARLMVDWNKVEALYHEPELAADLEPAPAAAATAPNRLAIGSRAAAPHPEQRPQPDAGRETR